MSDTRNHQCTHPPSGATDPRSPADACELALIAATIARMPQPRREVFLAARVDGASYGQIGEQLGLTVAEVQAEFAAAMRQIGHARRGRSPAALWRRWFHRLTYRQSR